MSFIAELKRRRVFRVAAVYAVVAWAIIQFSDTVMPRLGLPSWSVTLVIVLVAIGALIALVLAWAFDVGPDGITRTPSPSTSSTRFGRIAVAGAVVVLAGVGLAFFAKGRPDDLSASRIAVAQFENRTGDPAFMPIGRMTADFIIRGLSETGQVDVAGTAAELSSSDKSSTTEDQIRLVAHKYDAGVVVTGSLYREGDDIMIVAHITDAREGKLMRTIGPVSFHATSKPTEAVERMRQLATGGIVALVSPTGQGFVSVSEASHLPTWDSYRLYLQGVAEFSAREMEKSGASFIKSYEADTLFLLPVIRAAYAWGNIPDDPRVDSVAKFFETRRNRLSAFETAYLNRAVARSRGDHAAAYRASHELLRLRPNSANAKYLAARDAIPVNRPNEAIDLLKKIDLDDPELPTGVDVHRDWSRALHLTGKHRKELKVVDDALRRYPGNLDAIGGRMVALAALGRLDEVSRLADEVELQTQSETNSTTPGGVLMATANELAAHGHPDAARTMAGRAAAWFSNRGTQPVVTALALIRAGDAREAVALLDTVVSRDSTGLLGVRAMAAIVLKDVDKARALDKQLAELQVKRRAPRSLMRARIAALLGEKERAVRLIRESIAQGTQFSTGLHADIALSTLRGYKPYDDLMRPRD